MTGEKKNGGVKQAIIPVAGWGTRLMPVSYAVPKELLPVGGKPALQWIAEELASCGITHQILVTSPEKPDMDRLFRDNAELARRLSSGDRAAWDSLWCRGPYRDTRISVAVQPRQLGLGHAVLCGQPLLDEGPVVVALGDCLIGPPGVPSLLRRMLDCLEQRKSDAVIALETVPPEKVSRYGIADPAEAGSIFRLRDLVEKPLRDSAPSNYAVAARYILTPAVFRELAATEPGAGGEIQLTDALRRAIRGGATVHGVLLADGERRYDIGDHRSYARVFLEFTRRLHPEYLD